MSDPNEPPPAPNVAPLLLALRELIEATRAEAGRAADLIEGRVAPALERIAAALERAPMAMASAPAVSDAEAVRQAIREGRWDDARDRVATLIQDDPAAARLAEELARAEGAAVADLSTRLDAARQVNDPEGVLEARRGLTPLLRGDPLRQLDKALVPWFLALIQRRLRVGMIQADLVALAGSVSETFLDTPEVAGLRASLPTLRRSAGLCPRCSGPYKGLAEACPACMAASTAPAATQAKLLDAAAFAADDDLPQDDGPRLFIDDPE